MQVPRVEDFPVKTFNFLDLEVTSEVISITYMQADAICVRVKSSCESVSWGMRTQENPATIYLSNPDPDLFSVTWYWPIIQSSALRLARLLSITT